MTQPRHALLEQIGALIDPYTTAAVTAAVAAQQATDQQTIDAVTAQLATATAEIVQLQAQINTAPAAQPFRFGLDTANNAAGQTGTPLATRVTQTRAAYGTLGPHMKFFDGSNGWATAYRNMRATDYGTESGEVEPVMCANKDDVAGFNQLMTDMADHPVWWACHFQEVNDNITAGSYSPAAYRAAWQKMATARAAHPNGSQCKFIPIMNGYTLTISAAAAKAKGADMPTLLAGLELDALGVDLYDGPGFAVPWNPADHFGTFAAEAKALGAPLAIPEHGVQVSSKTKTDTDATVAARIAANIAWARDNCLWLSYWENGAWSQIGKPGQYVLLGALAAT